MGHLHIPHLGSSAMKDVPKGCLAIKVGQEGKELQRFVVPILYFRHPLFLELLKEAEEEYGFDHKGTITLPCDVAQFGIVRGMIEEDYSFRDNHNSNHGHGNDHNHHHHHHHNTLLVGCFKA